uniref:collagen alpha-1(XXIII) chain-like n=1 Tax=Doryrhamphus excisus TaxID=161450 RepID=UPI0025AE8F9F|nr:collagen alpha-1(XXIII) chain-like [Doryrhamphus excisus]
MLFAKGPSGYKHPLRYTMEDEGARSQKNPQKNASKKLQLRCREVSAVTLALLLLCFGVCIGVLVRTTTLLQSRIVRLEQQQISAWMFSLEQVEPLLLDRLDQILDKKLAERLPKTRGAREAPYSCLCPPGPPVSRADPLCDPRGVK